jgi:hypothetical protein
VLTARTEVTDRMLLFGQRHVQTILAEYEAYHNGRRGQARAELVVLARDAQVLLGRPYGEVPAVHGSFSVRPPAKPDVPVFPASGFPVTYAVAVLAAGGRAAWI